MKGYGSESAIFGHAREFDADDFFVVPSGAEFHGEGNLHGGADRFENLADCRKVAQQAGAAVALHDFLGGTSEVQVDEVEAESLDHFGGFGHHLGIAAEKLGRDRVLVFVEVEIALGLLIFLAQNSVGRGELGHDETASAEVADEAAEDGVGDAGHGREDSGWGDCDRADLQGGGNNLWDGDIAGVPCQQIGRIVPKFAHISEVNATTGAKARAFWSLYAALKRRSSTFRFALITYAGRRRPCTFRFILIAYAVIKRRSSNLAA